MSPKQSLTQLIKKEHQNAINGAPMCINNIIAGFSSTIVLSLKWGQAMTTYPLRKWKQEAPSKALAYLKSTKKMRRILGIVGKILIRHTHNMKEQFYS